MNIPQYRAPGDIAELICDYDLGNDNLYAVKWYKDHEEFYRFVPRAKPEALSFKIEGITVDVSTYIFLVNIPYSSYIRYGIASNKAASIEWVHYEHYMQRAY